jgi:hypothetical protein
MAATCYIGEVAAGVIAGLLFYFLESAKEAGIPADGESRMRSDIRSQ